MGLFSRKLHTRFDNHTLPWRKFKHGNGKNFDLEKNVSKFFWIFLAKCFFNPLLGWFIVKENFGKKSLEYVEIFYHFLKHFCKCSTFKSHTVGHPAPALLQKGKFLKNAFSQIDLDKMSRKTF